MAGPAADMEPGGIESDRVVPDRARVLGTGLGSFALTLVVALLGLSMMDQGFAVIWPAAGLVTGLWLVADRALRTPVIAGLVAGLFVGNLIADRSLPLNLLMVSANCGEAWLVAFLFRRWTSPPVRIETMHHAGAFVAAVAISVSLGALLGVPLLQLTGVDGGLGFGRLWTTWVNSRGLGMLTVTPAVVSLALMTRASWRDAWGDGKGTLALMLGVGVVAYALLSSGFSRDSLLSLLTLLLVVYPFQLWLAARRPPVWTYVSLLLFTMVVAWRLGYGGGMLEGNLQVAQAFLLISSLWALTLAIVLEQQRQAMERARRSEHRMLEALAAGRGFTFDYVPRTGRVRRADPDGILAPFGEEKAEDFFARLLPEDKPRLQEKLAALSPQRPMYEVSYGSRRPDGKVVWLQERAVAEFDANGVMQRLQGLTMDITRRREVEEALREADRKKDLFIATLAHELRNPLAPIRTSAELLASPLAGAAEVGYASNVIRRQVRHMSSLLDDLLDIARITQGKLKLRKSWVRLDGIVETAVEAARPIIDSHRQRLVIDLPRPAPVLEADPLRIAQVISNLLANAARYSGDGSEITLNARVDGGMLELAVIDHGIGLEATQLEAIFQMFSQVSGASVRGEGGLGIGLAITKGLVELHGGRITAQSDGVGQGSRFTVTLPCVPLSAPEGSKAQVPSNPAVTASGRRILVVDDNHDAADSLAMLLQLDGHEVRVAYCGNDALAALQSGFKPELAILDLGLPDLSGHELARRIRLDPSFEGTMLVALTGWGQDEDKQRARESGFDHHLTKPVDPDRLASLIAAR